MILGSLTSLILLFAFWFHNWKRAQVTEVQELKPNCLLTSSPLVFIPGKRSLFYFLAYWNEIPHWLASHGYEVFTFPLPWQNSKKRIAMLENFLNRQSQSHEKLHLFVDNSSFEEVSFLLEKKHYPCLASVTLIGKSADQDLCFTPKYSTPIEEVELPEASSLQTPLFWLFHRLWTFQSHPPKLSQLGWKLSRVQGDFLLSRVQFLAERDLLQSQRTPTLKS